MGSTNRTTRARLSQFEPDDKPSWQGDYNLDMKRIDDALIDTDGKIATQNTTIGTQAAAVSAAQAQVAALDAAVTDAQALVANLKAQLDGAASSVQTLTNKNLSDGSNVFPSTLVTKTGSAALTNKDLTDTSNSFPAALARISGAAFTGAVTAPNLPACSGSVQGKRMHWGTLTATTDASSHITVPHALGWTPTAIFCGVITGGTAVCTVARSIDSTHVEMTFAFISTGATVGPGVQLAFSYLWLE